MFETGSVGLVETQLFFYAFMNKTVSHNFIIKGSNLQFVCVRVYTNYIADMHTLHFAKTCTFLWR